MIFGNIISLLATEYVLAKKPEGDVFLFRRGRVPGIQPKLDEESNADDRVNTETIARDKTVSDVPASIQKQTQVFHSDGLIYDMKTKGKPRKLTDEVVNGWIRPRTLTAFDGMFSASSAGSWSKMPKTVSGVSPGPARPLYLYQIYYEIIKLVLIWLRELKFLLGKPPPRP